jgi:hypothetical protein
MKLYDDLYSPYPANHASRLDAAELWLAERCVITNDGQWWVRQQDGHWEKMGSKKAAAHSMRQNWKQGDAAMRMTVTDIKMFMDYTAPCVRGAMKVPTSTASFISCFGGVFLNSWFDDVMKPNPVALAEPTLRLRLQAILRMIRESLCGLPGRKSLDDMIAVLNGNDPAELPFRFACHWLAAPLQQIGRNLQTNLWFVGEQNGTGKGTLSLMLAMIYGFSNSVLLNEDELSKGGWTDTIEGALFISWNEMRANAGWDANSLLKQNSTESVLQIRKRNTHSHPALNFANWLITGNKETAPWGALDHNDRRNAIFACTDSPAVLGIAKDVREWLEHQPDEVQIVLGGLVYLLQHIAIDEELIRWAPETEIKSEMQAAASPEIDGLYWLENDEAYQRDTFLPARQYLEHYKRFMDIPKLTPRRFSASILGKLARKGYIEKQKQYDTSVIEFRIPSAKYPVWAAEQKTNAAAKGNVLALIPANKRG